jgi:CRP/FNR family transcriptional regulator, anaerobic regulatory protein
MKNISNNLYLCNLSLIPMYINPNYSLFQNPMLTVGISRITGAGKREVVDKGGYILTEGQACDFLFFVVSGAFRTFRWVEDKEVTIGFTFDGDFDSCPYAFINNLPSTDMIQALTDSVIIRVAKSDLEKLSQKEPELNELITYLLSHYVEILVRRMIDFRLLTAEELYLNLLARQPDEVKAIPLQYIASYLGISSERLSRIRKKLRN